MASSAHLLANSVSPDGGRLLFMDFADNNVHLRAYNLQSRELELVDIGGKGVYSPDGQWIAYIATATRTLVVRRPEGGGRVQVSAGAGSQVRWRADMKELFYIASDKKMMSVPLTVRDGVLEPGTPVPLFQTRIVQPRLVLFQYDITPDGERFLINSLPREDTAAPLTLLVNWMEGT